MVLVFKKIWNKEYTICLFFDKIILNDSIVNITNS